MGTTSPAWISATSFISTKSSGTADSSSTTLASFQQSIGSYQRSPYPSGISPHQSAEMETTSGRKDHTTDVVEPSLNSFAFCANRSDVDDDDFAIYQLDSKTGAFPVISGYYVQVQYDDFETESRSHKVHPDAEATETKCRSSSSLHNSFGSQDSEGVQELVEKDEREIGDQFEVASSSLYAAEENVEHVDFENNGVLWLPPEPEDEEDETEAFLFDDDDGDDGDATGEWGYLRASSSFGSGECRNRDRSNEEHKKAMKNVVDGHFRALVSQLLQVENLPMGQEDEKENWLEIITSLSWEAALILKPDMSKGGGMDPGGYVKIKCLASGHRSGGKRSSKDGCCEDRCTQS